MPAIYMSGWSDWVLIATSIPSPFPEMTPVMREIARILRIDARPRRLCAAAKTQQEIADALQPDHHFHAGQQLASLGLRHLGNGRGHTRVNFHIQVVELSFTIAECVKERRRAGCDALRRRSCRFLRDSTSLDGTRHQV